MSSTLLNISFENHKVPEFKEVKNKDWVYFGEDNLYPEYLIEQALRSAKHGAILAGKVNYIYGGGLHVVDKGSSITARAIANKFIKQLNDDNFIRKMIQDFEWFNGFYIEPILTKGGKLESINYIPFSKIRVSADEKKLFYSNDWRAGTRQDKDKTGYKEFDVFDFENPKSGALFYYKIVSPKNGRDRNVYPVPEYIGACASIETDIEIANYHLNNIKTGFAVGTIVNFNNGTPEGEGQEVIEKMLKKKFQGTDRAGSVAISFNASSENAPTITSFTPSDLDKQFIEISKRVEQDIFTGHKITNPALFGVNATGVVFQRNDLVDSFELFQNTYTDGRQHAIEDVINQFASLNGVSAKIEFKRTLAVSFGLTDTQINSALTNDEVREKLGLPAIKKVDGGGSDIVNALNTLSPLVATKVLEAMTSEEIRALIGLKGGSIKTESTSTQMSSQNSDDLYEVLFETEFKGESDEDIVSSFMQFKKKQLVSTDRAIIDLLEKDSLMPSNEIAKILKIDVSDVNRSIAELDREGYLSGTEVTKKGSDIIDDEGAKTQNIEVKYKYVWRPGVTPDDNARDKCKEWLKATSSQSGWFSRNEIDRLNNGEGLGVWESRGGWWNKDGKVNVPYCRHLWKAMVVKRK